MYILMRVGMGWAVFKRATGFWQQVSKEYLYKGNAKRKLREVRNGN